MRRLESVKQHRAQLLQLANEHGAYNVRIFGSVVRGDERPGSDVDFLVSFRDGTSLFDVGGLLVDYKELLGCDVDIVSDRALKQDLRHTILASAQPL